MIPGSNCKYVAQMEYFTGLSCPKRLLWTVLDMAGCVVADFPFKTWLAKWHPGSDA